MTVRFADRAAPDVLPATENVTVELSLPLLAEVNVIQLAPLDTDQAQPVGVLMPRLPVPPTDPKDVALGASE